MMKYLKKTIIVLISVLICFASLSSSVFADGDYSVWDDLDNPPSYPSYVDTDDYLSRAQFQAWSILKAYGMTDAQAIGIMTNMQCEGGYSSFSIEGWSYSNAIDIFGGREAYNNGTAQQMFVEQHDDYTVAFLQDHYLFTADEISVARQGRNRSNYHGTAVGGAGYFCQGSGYCGIGLCQWTGGRAKLLLDWSVENNCDWWVFPNQICWMFTPPEEGGDSAQPYILRYFEATANASASECCRQWFTVYEMGGGDTSSSFYLNHCAERSRLAGELYAIWTGRSWDNQWGLDVLSGAGLVGHGHFEGIEDEGILNNYSDVVLYYPMNGGFLFLDEAESLQPNNENVLRNYVNGTECPQYALFELFGEDLHWYRYFGEQTELPKYYDHAYSGFIQNKVDQLFNEGDFNILEYQANQFLSCNVYQGRVPVLTTQNVADGRIDPRVSQLRYSRFSGYPYVLGTISMAIAKFFVSLTSVIVGHTLFDKFVELLNFIETGYVWTTFIAPIIYFIVAFAVIAFLFSIVKMVSKYAQGMGSSPKEIIMRFLVGFIGLGIIFCSTANPSNFNNIMLGVATAMDRVFESSLASSLEGDEVAGVSNSDIVTEAVLWKTCIFNAWCRGQFEGREYDELYTTYANLDEGQSAMPQSNSTESGSDSTPYYNSAESTGDVFVPIGNGVEVRNWAAYLYSCGSKYHIDSTIDEEYELPEVIEYPVATTTFSNRAVFADTFRVIDAQMDISPQYYNDGTQVNNYIKSKGINPEFFSQSAIMLVNSALLMLIIPPVFKKLKNFVLMIILTIQSIYFTIIELFKPDTGFRDLSDNFKKSIGGYFVGSVQTYIILILYMNFVDKGFVWALVYVILCLTVLGFNLQDAKRAIGEVKNTYYMIKKKLVE